LHSLHRSTPKATRLGRAIAVTSGKGGVGKSNVAVNLAVALSMRGLRVCLVDGDLGLANADILCNLSPRLTLEHVMAGQCRLADAMLLAPGGFRLIPGASGVTRLADMGPSQRQSLLRQLAALDRVADFIIIDCGAGISANVIGLAAAASEVLVTTTPEPTALADGYAMVKTLLSNAPESRLRLVVNMTDNEMEAQAVFRRINKVTRMFLQRSIEFGGAIPADESVTDAVRSRVPFVLFAPDNPASQAVRRLAAKMVNAEPESGCVSNAQPTAGFFLRFANWLGLVELEGEQTGDLPELRHAVCR
jgi:flagellar biosynthesis protein FlhG